MKKAVDGKERVVWTRGNKHGRRMRVVACWTEDAEDVVAEGAKEIKYVPVNAALANFHVDPVLKTWKDDLSELVRLTCLTALYRCVLLTMLLCRPLNFPSKVSGFLGIRRRSHIISECDASRRVYSQCSAARPPLSTRG